MEAQRIREGVKLVQEGDKASSKGLFRKPDWDVASGCYDHAATSFKLARSYDQAVQAYLKASEAFFKADATHLSGKALENAALLLAQQLNQPQRAAELYQRASNMFMTRVHAGSIDRAAEQLEKAGRALENTDVNAAIEMYSSACSLYEQEDRGRMAIDIFKKAVALLIRSKKYERAVDMLHRQSAVLRKLANRSHLYKANLSIIIVLFAIGDEVEAGKQFNYMSSNDPGFLQSEEAEIGQLLLQAYNEGDQGLLEQAVRMQHISFLDNEVAKLSRTLTVPGEMLSSGGMGSHQRMVPSQPPSTTSAGGAATKSPNTAYHSGGTNGASRTSKSPATNVAHGMSPAQVRAELYSTPSSKYSSSEKAMVTSASSKQHDQYYEHHQQQSARSPLPPPPQAVEQSEKDHYLPTQSELDEEFAQLNMQQHDEKKKPFAPAPLPQEEDDDFDLR
ncbi:hypothetical protein BDB00DRAFT_793510 [Zychaea mexicana]|uniref:uncharacterized protein n=1 Tax=Zychaea mexicana TaxID=64656 RepID=UPI0022FE88A7|nr:uncharacterized protein BDB00DRAFT_793510 [Zychaea mexicana]KAI9472919.1 hypothetical protein BDB00DRAFT_793510 [Zychaea mexicana]